MLHLVAPAGFGGLEAVVQALVLGSRDSAVEAQVAAVVRDSGESHPFLVPLAQAGVEVFPIVVSGLDYLGERAAVAQLCRRLRPDVVHTHGYRVDVLDAAVARKLGIPIVTTVHGFTGGDWKNRCYQWLQRRAFRRFDAIVAVSRPLAEELARDGMLAQRVHLVPNAWRPAARPLDRVAARRALGEGQSRSAPCLGWVGRLSEEKGPDVFVKALAGLRDRSWTACVVGDGPARPRLEREAAVLGVGDRIHWHGRVSGAASLFTAFDVFVLSSRTEGTPIVLFEALASEVPIVATAVGGVADVVSQGQARLVAPEDPSALAAAIAEVLDDPVAARARALAGRSRLEREFGDESWLQRYEMVYRSIARPRSPDNTV